METTRALQMFERALAKWEAIDQERLDQDISPDHFLQQQIDVVLQADISHLTFARLHRPCLSAAAAPPSPATAAATQ